MVQLSSARLILRPLHPFITIYSRADPFTTVVFAVQSTLRPEKVVTITLGQNIQGPPRPLVWILLSEPSCAGRPPPRPHLPHDFASIFPSSAGDWSFASDLVWPSYFFGGISSPPWLPRRRSPVSWCVESVGVLAWLPPL